MEILRLKDAGDPYWSPATQITAHAYFVQVHGWQFTMSALMAHVSLCLGRTWGGK